MAVAYESQASGTQASSTTLTFSATPGGSNRCLIVVAGARSNTVTLSATFNGVAMTQIAQLNVNQNDVCRLAAFYLNAPFAGTANVVITSSGSTNLRGCAVNYTGTLQTSSVIDGSNSGQNDGVSSLTVSITTSVANTWGVCCHANTIDAATAVNSYTNRSGAGTLPGVKISDSNASLTPGSNSAVMTGNGGFDDLANIFFGIREASAAAPQTTGFLMQYLAQQ